jgi:hypothetical protein
VSNLASRHEAPMSDTSDTRGLHPRRQGVCCLPCPIAGRGKLRGCAALPTASRVERRGRADGQSRLTALRFLFTVTLRKPEIVVEPPFIKEPRRLPVVFSPKEVARLADEISKRSGVRRRSRDASAYSVVSLE